MVLHIEYHFGINFIFEKLVPLKQDDDARNFEPLYADISHLQAGLTTQQPFLTIPNYGHFGQKIEFPVDFIFRNYTLLKRARDDKNFELLYVQKTQSLADLAAQMTIFD